MTGEVLNRGNYPVLTRFIAGIRSASRRGGSRRAAAMGVLAQLSADGGLQAKSCQDCIDRCERAVACIESDEKLLELASLDPFGAGVTHWWPQTLESEYEEPVRKALQKLDADHMGRLTGNVKQLQQEGIGLLAPDSSIDPTVDLHQVERTVLGATKAYAEVVDQLQACELESFLVARNTQLGKLASPETLPADELETVGEKALHHHIRVARAEPLDDEGLGCHNGQEIPDPAIADNLRDRLSDGGGRRKGSRRRLWTRWVDRSVKVTEGLNMVNDDLNRGLAAGGVLAIVDVSAAATVVGVALSVAASVYTGVKSARSTLRRMGDEV